LNKQEWLGLMIGNSRLHWAYFAHDELQQTWNTSKVDSLTELPQVISPQLNTYLQCQIPLYVASVVPSATKLYLKLPQTTIINSRKIPLGGVYPTMGVDRILALWGGGCRYQFPCLVIDSGTALTFTGANRDRQLMGGAILPGVRLQMETLFFNTAALPEIEIMEQIIPRWAMDTPCAIQSGIIYTIVGGIKGFIDDWLRQYPQSAIVLTGGDTVILQQYLKQVDPPLAHRMIFDPDLIFFGIQEYIRGN